MSRNVATAFAPASVANVAVGFDLLGFSLGVTGDKVRVEKTQSTEIYIDSISGVMTNITKDPLKNTASAGLVKLQKDLNLNFGFKISIEKGIALGSGMGGSAASAVAAIVAANALLDQPLTEERLIDYALVGEAQASGSFHADNVAPCLLGGLIFSRVRKLGEIPSVEAVSLPVPQGIYCSLVHPEISVETKQARGILKSEISMAKHIEQSANLAGFIAGCFQNDTELIRRSLAEIIVEPQRAHLIPGFYEVKSAALSQGAIGCSISGAGPSIFALATNQLSAKMILENMIRAFQKAGVSAQGWAVPLDQKGARLTP